MRRLDGLGFIIIIIIAIVSIVSKEKKLNKNRPGQGRSNQTRPGQQARPAQAKPQQAVRPAPPPAQPATPAPGPVAPTEPTRQPNLQELLQELLHDAEDIPAETPAQVSSSAEGDSFADDKDCVGGSLPHDEAALHEGESGVFTEPARTRKREPAAAAAIVAPQRGGFHPDAAEMRRAVVMSEILGRPKALRARGVR